MSRTSQEGIEIGEGPGFKGLEATPRVWMCERVDRDATIPIESNETYKHHTKYTKACYQLEMIRTSEYWMDVGGCQGLGVLRPPQGFGCVREWREMPPFPLSQIRLSHTTPRLATNLK